MKNGILKSVLTAFTVFTVFTSNVWAADLNQGLVKEDVFAYKAPSEEAEVTCYLNAGEELVVIEETDNYYGILIEDDELVYIEKRYLQVQNSLLIDEEIQKAPLEQESLEVNKGKELVDYAKQFIGLRYQSGGTSLTTGVDCSGFTQQVYAKFNVSLERISRDQYASNGKKVNKSELLPGDLVFYGVNGRVRHVAIYAGNDQIIHAPVPGKYVCVVPMWQRGNDPIIGYKRIF